MIEAVKLPYDTFYRLNRLLNNDVGDKRTIVRMKDEFGIALVEHGYLKFHEEDATEDWITDYKIYRPTKKMEKATEETIIKELTGLDLSDAIKQKTISIEDLPYDYEDVFDALAEVGGFMDHIDIEPGKFKEILEFHGFTRGTGVNGVYSAGTSKLKELIKKRDYYSIIEAITGKTKEENEEVLRSNREKRMVAEMFSIAKEFGYSITKKEEDSSH